MAYLYDLTAPQDSNLVKIKQCVNPMSDHDHDAATERLSYDLLHSGIRVAVQTSTHLDQLYGR